MRALHFCIPLALLLAKPTSGIAQHELELSGEMDGSTIIVRGVSTDPEQPEPVFQAVWRLAPNDATFALQRTSTAPNGGSLALDQLMESAIGTYLDAHVHFAKEGVKADLPADRMINDLSAMARAACAELDAPDAFTSFSEPTAQQLSRLTRIDWSQARFGIDGGGDQDKYLAIYYYVRTQRDELERQIHADLMPLQGVKVLGTAEGWAGTTVRIASTCGTVFDEDNFLCALDLAVPETEMIDPGMSASSFASLSAAINAPPETPAVEEPVRIRKRDRWLKSELDNINERIDRMDQRKELWAIRDRLDDVEGRLDDIQLQVDDVRELSSDRDNPAANLSALSGQNITVRFARNSTALDADSRVLLNEVFEQLARAPSDKVLITGYTDRSGDPEVNLSLSERRAKAVRTYLLERGIASDRLMVNYYGDSRSEHRDPTERRVEIEWLP